MSFMVTLPHGKSLDLDAVTVIRSVSEKESDSYNERLASSPNAMGIVPSRRWTIALEVLGENGRVTPRYTSHMSVAELIGADPYLKQRFALIDDGRAAVAATIKAHLIRPLEEREESGARAVVHFEGGSTNGLLVTRTAEAIKAELGTRAAHLTPIGKEGFIDRSRIESVSAFDAAKELKPGQTRFAIAVRFKGVYRPQYFEVNEAVLRGEPVLDLRQGAARPADMPGKSKPAAAPEVR